MQLESFVLLAACLEGIEYYAKRLQNPADATNTTNSNTDAVIRELSNKTGLLSKSINSPTYPLPFLSDKASSAPAPTCPLPTTQAKVPVQGHCPIQAAVAETCPAVNQCPIQAEIAGTCPAPITAGYFNRAYNALAGAASYAAPYAFPLLGAAVLTSALYAAYGLYSTRQEELAAKNAREAFEGRIADLGLVSMNKAASALGGLAGQFASRARFVLATIINLAGILTNAGKLLAATTVATATIGHKSAFGGIGKNVARLSLSAANTGVAAAGVAIPELARFTLEGEYKLAGIEANRVDRAIYAAAG